MKSISKLLAVLLLLCSLWPFAEFFVNQWRNPEPLTLSAPATVCTASGSEINVQQGSTATLTDYLIHNCAEISGGKAVGLTHLFAQIPCNVLLRISNAATLQTVQVTQILAVSAVLARTVYVLMIFFAVLVLLMPVLLVTKFWRSKT